MTITKQMYLICDNPEAPSEERAYIRNDGYCATLNGQQQYVSQRTATTSALKLYETERNAQSAVRGRYGKLTKERIISVNVIIEIPE